jgi:hypothetical protein
MPEHASLPKIVVACTPENRSVLEEVLRGVAHPVMALSEDEAFHSIDPDVSLLVCTLRFDDSRMLDFLRIAREQFAHLPCVCCRVGKGSLPDRSLHAALDAALELGASDVIDFFALEAERGHSAAIDAFRARLFEQLARH